MMSEIEAATKNLIFCAMLPLFGLATWLALSDHLNVRQTVFALGGGGLLTGWIFTLVLAVVPLSLILALVAALGLWSGGWGLVVVRAANKARALEGGGSKLPEGTE